MPPRVPPPSGKKLNFGSGWDIRSAKEGWVNLDGFVHHPDVIRHDFTRFPYPFRADEFDYVLANHVFEHIPFLYLDWNGTKRDVLFSIMEELHRVLKPGGKLHILTPLGGTHEAMMHVQHYRQWFPESFNYFQATPGEETGKYHVANFRLVKVHLNRRVVRNPSLMRMGRTKLGIQQHLYARFPRLLGWILLGRNELEGILEAVKDDHRRPSRRAQV